MAERVKVSVICTVRNEMGSIVSLLGSLLRQSRKPDEIIVVDGGSTDGTVEFIKRKYGKKIRVISKPKANIAKGRNIAIAAARFPYIASIDGGCVADGRWLEELTKPFPLADVVAGVYEPLANNGFERAQGKVVCKPVGKLGKGFLPSSRSVAFRKSSWRSVGGYPEDTYTAEDTLFDKKLKDAGFRFALARKAVVYWRMRKSLKSFAKQFYLYGFGDGRTKLIWKMPANLALVLLFLFGVAGLAAGVLVFPAALAILLLAEAAVRTGRDDILRFPVYLALVTVKRAAYCVGAVQGALD
jgi:glycosyltransferase involved in cell wall biosynthesis